MDACWSAARIYINRVPPEHCSHVARLRTYLNTTHISIYKGNIVHCCWTIQLTRAFYCDWIAFYRPLPFHKYRNLQRVRLSEICHCNT